MPCANYLYLCHMELFYSKNISSGELNLNQEESNHCIKVLRHKIGDEIYVIDGQSFLYRCRIFNDNPKNVGFEILETLEGFGAHNYYLHMAVAPPKNIDRFEWFAEKATEIAIDELTPVFGDYSERKVIKTERVERILVSAAKQSHKGAVPIINEGTQVKDFLKKDFEGFTKLICYCDDVTAFGTTKTDIKKALGNSRKIVIMIGPEGDFSREEIKLAIDNGWQPVSLGESRLRIETAALVATSAVYLLNE